MAAVWGCATITGKSTGNQDYCLSIKNEVAKFSGIIITDGIGSHYKAEVSAKFCCELAKRIFEEIKDVSEINFEVIFKDIKGQLIQFAKSSDEFDFDNLDRNQSLGTTLICVIDTGAEYLIAYSGNGSVWLVDGRFNQFNSNFILPWNAVNLLNPHSIEQEGKPALYRFLSIGDVQCLPTVIKISQNKFKPGDMIIATTDGIFSNDQVPIGRDESGTIWIQGEETMAMLFRALSGLLGKNPVTLKNEDLEFGLNQYLNELQDKQLLHDDTTLGVVISQHAIDYHQDIFNKRIR